MSDELKRCPFCGGEATFGANSRPGHEYIRCGSCKARTYSCYETQQEAIEAWNSRAAVTDEQFAMAVHEWALARMEGCDEPEWSMYSGIVDAIGRHRAASAKVVG